jgi:signal transduction histidine kinase
MTGSIVGLYIFVVVMMGFALYSIRKFLTAIRAAVSGEHRDRESDSKLNEVNEIYSLVRKVKEHDLRIQEEQKKIELAQNRIQIISQFAHDVRSPVAALKVVSKSMTAMPEDLQKLIRIAVSRIEAIAGTLLEKYKADQSPLKSESPTEFELVRLCQEIIEEKKIRFLDQSGFRIEGIFPAVDIVLTVDRTQLGRVLSNLVENAIESYADLSKSVVVEIEVRLGDEVLIFVRDFGRGFPKSVLEAIRKQKTIVSSREKGHGIGLSHAIQSIALMNGRLEIESVEGEGSEIQISFTR